MARRDELDGFAREALAAGRAPEQVAALLTDAGWAPREIRDSLDAWLPGPPGLPPVPRPRPYVSGREALVYGMLFILLAMICWHLTALGMQVADALLPQPDETWRPPASAMRFNMAALITAVPLFAWLNRRVARETAADRGRKRSLVRRWFATLTLLLSALALVGDAVAVVYSLLDGDLTLRFVVKAALVMIVAGLAFAYYRDELEER